MKRNRQANTKRSKQARNEPIVQNPKAAQWQLTNGINVVELTESQDDLVQKIRENTVTFVEGPAGAGKTFAILCAFIKEYLKDNRKQIYIIRTPVEVGMDKLGYLPSDLNTKIEPHFASAKAILEKLLNKGKVETDLNNRIHFKVPNHVLGATFDDALVLIDEVQQLPPLILKLLLERTGKNTKVVIAGDSSQLYTFDKGRNALRDALPRFFYEPEEGYLDRESKFYDFAHHKFTVEDIQRHEVVKCVVEAYSED